MTRAVIWCVCKEVCGVDDSSANLALAATQAATTVGVRTGPSPSQVRTTVLPRTSEGHSDDGTRARYERVKPLAAGGMGEVDLAHDRDIDRPVAVKRVLEAGSEGVALLRFAEEIRALGTLDHPGIVPVHDVGIDEEGRHFAVMKYVTGETLEQIIAGLRRRETAYVERFTHAYRARVFASVLEAVDFAHRRGFVHRDLKPANIMVGADGEVTVLDWGLARAAATNETPAQPQASDRLLATQDGALLGTPMYMSPEQARGENMAIDARSDVFSLSLVFWEFMSLEHAFGDRKTLPELLSAIGHQQVTSLDLALSRIRTNTPCEYSWFALRGLENKPEARFASVAAMLADFRQLQAGKFPVQCDVTLTKRALHELEFWIDRHGWLFRVVLLGVIAAVVYVVMRTR